MKHSRLLILISVAVWVAFALAACQSTAPSTQVAAPPSAPAAASQPDVEARNLAVVQRFYDEYAAGHADVILEVHPETITMHYAGSAEEVPTQVLRDDLAALKAANPDLRAEVHQMFAAGDLVVTELTWTTTHTGDYFGIPATGKTTTHSGIVVRRLKDGQIVESWEMWDDLVFLQSIGYLPSWDEIIASGSAAEPTASETSEILASKPGDLIGVWRGQPGSPGDPPQTYWWFQADGTYRVTFEIERFSDNYSVEQGRLSFDGTTLTLEAAENGCAGAAAEAKATYEARVVVRDGNQPVRLKLTPVSEPCAARRNALSGSMAYKQPQP